MTGLARVALCVMVIGGGGSACRSQAPRVQPAESKLAATGIPPSTVATASADDAPARPLRRCFPDQPNWSDAPVSDLLDQAGTFFDGDDFAGALACAEEAARAAPRSIEAHHDRAAALLRLGRLDEARDALTLAISLDPDDPETLEASADLYINQLPPSADRSAIGLEHARRGFRRASGHDRARAARLALLEGQALIDLGHSEQAVKRLDATLALAPRSVAARYEKGVAEFELCRFADAQRTFQKVLQIASDHAHALYHLGLIAEREGNLAAADKYFVEASRRDPASFPPPPELSATDFSQRVLDVVAELPAEARADLGGSHLETADLPAAEDLVAEKPPLSPTILGLFRGLPLTWSGEADGLGRPQTRRAANKGRRPSGPSGGPPAGADADLKDDGPRACPSADRTIVLYRRNLLRSIRNLRELDEAIRRTLLHEIGHLRGEDDGSLRDRGLE